MEWKELLDVLVPALAVVAAGGLGFLWKYVKKKVAETDNKIDDAAVKAVEKAIEDAKDK